MRKFRMIMSAIMAYIIKLGYGAEIDSIYRLFGMIVLVIMIYLFLTEVEKTIKEIFEDGR